MTFNGKVFYKLTFNKSNMIPYHVLDLTDEELQFKAKYCKDLIYILDQVNPGDCQKKGK